MSDRQRNLFETSASPWELDNEQTGVVASIIFPQPPFGPFDYLVPDTLVDAAQAGVRVRVPLGGGNRMVVGYCMDVQTREVGARRLKPIQSVLDEAPLLSPSMLRLTRWISDYYLCPLGQTVEAVVPSGVRGQAGTRQKVFLSVPTNVAARLTQLKLPPKQARALRLLAAAPQPMTAQQLAQAAGCTLAPIQALQKKRLLKGETRRVDSAQVQDTSPARETPPELNHEQQAALAAVLAALRREAPETLLIHGVTGSGKTEVYIRAIEEVLQYGRQAIVLVPEISLTPQTRQRFRSRFSRVAVLHSGMSDSERHWHWKRIRRGEVDVVVGARSAIFAPTPNLGLIILDEEHDFSFKQDIAPRYHARRVAVERSRMESAPLILGSATPSLESWRHAQAGEYTLLEMPRRVLDRPMPDVAAIDLRTEFRNQSSRGAISRGMRRAIHDALQEGGQIILLLNRRGYSTNIQCPACGHVMRCDHCDIALTHHRQGERALCHYCDFETPAPRNCPSCGFEGIRYGGLGTQRLEDEIRSRFAGAECLRMDTDSMQGPGSHEKAFDRFRRGEIRILLGTQMIAKGLDFPNVTLVGVINADTALHFPDFRAAERTFQLVTQVAGRTGRGAKGGRVLVQTFSPEHPAIQAAMQHDYVRFAQQELPIRQEYGYPPFGSMVRVVIRGESEQAAEQFAATLDQFLADQIQSSFEQVRQLGPAPAPMAKLRGKFRYHVLLLSDQPDPVRQLAKLALATLAPPENVQWIADVDPLDML